MLKCGLNRLNGYVNLNKCKLQLKLVISLSPVVCSPTEAVTSGRPSLRPTSLGSAL